MIKKILIAVLLLVLIGVGTGIYMWYKPHPQPKDAKYKYPVTADSLNKVYSADEKAANAKFVGDNKAVIVSGVINGVSKNQDGQLIVTLDSGDPMADVQCTMADSTGKEIKGQNISLICFCKGNNMGVVLTDCSIK